MEDTQAHVRIQNQLTVSFRIAQELKQGDGLALTLFNIALEYVIRKTSINSTNILINKSTQITAYADDINIMGNYQQ